MFRGELCTRAGVKELRREVKRLRASPLTLAERKENTDGKERARENPLRGCLAYPHRVNPLRLVKADSARCFD